MPASSLSRPYLFYGQTQSLCERCHEVVPAKIVFQNDNVYYLKRCAEHGQQKTLISTDIDYYLRCKNYLKPGDMPHVFQTRIERGCPHDCGLCPDHEQHSCLAIFDIIDECNMRCPICYAGSGPKQGNPKSMAQIEAMLETLVASELEPDLVQISGGEPTLHPQIHEIIARLMDSPIRHLMLNTNGIRIAREDGFVERLAEHRRGFEVYLQFDSLQADALKNIRGIDARATRQKALEKLEAHGISTTLVCTVKRGVNDQEIDAIVEYAQSWRCVRGVTFQPIQEAGRSEDFGKTDRFTLSDIRRAIVDGDNPFTDADMLPLPCHPREHIDRLRAARRGQSRAGFGHDPARGAARGQRQYNHVRKERASARGVPAGFLTRRVLGGRGRETPGAAVLPAATRCAGAWLRQRLSHRDHVVHGRVRFLHRVGEAFVCALRDARRQNLSVRHLQSVLQRTQ